MTNQGQPVAKVFAMRHFLKNSLFFTVSIDLKSKYFGPESPPPSPTFSDFFYQRVMATLAHIRLFRLINRQNRALIPPLPPEHAPPAPRDDSPREKKIPILEKIREPIKQCSSRTELTVLILFQFATCEYSWYRFLRVDTWSDTTIANGWGSGGFTAASPLIRLFGLSYRFIKLSL